MVEPFDPGESAQALGRRTALGTLDAFLVTGGYPRLVAALRRHTSVVQFVSAQLEDDNSELINTGQRTLDAECPSDSQARLVLTAIGGDEVGRARFGRVVDGVRGAGQPPATAQTAVRRAVELLRDRKRVVTVDTPAGATSSRLTRYRIADPYLRFWVRFVLPHADDVARGQPDLAQAAFRRGWSTYRGAAIEPVVREAMFRLAPSLGWPEVDAVAPWWDRTGQREVDLVVTRRRQGVAAVGTIKWRDRRPITTREVRELEAIRASVPRAAQSQLVGVCPAGASDSSALDVVLDAQGVLNAW